MAKVWDLLYAHCDSDEAAHGGTNHVHPVMQYNEAEGRTKIEVLALLHAIGVELQAGVVIQPPVQLTVAQIFDVAETPAKSLVGAPATERLVVNRSGADYPYVAQVADRVALGPNPSQPAPFVMERDFTEIQEPMPGAPVVGTLQAGHVITKADVDRFRTVEAKPYHPMLVTRAIREEHPVDPMPEAVRTVLDRTADLLKNPFGGDL